MNSPGDAAVDGAALRGGLPGHALPRALRLHAHPGVPAGRRGAVAVGCCCGGGGGAVLARLGHCDRGTRDGERPEEEEEGEVGGPLEVAVLKTRSEGGGIGMAG